MSRHRFFLDEPIPADQDGTPVVLPLSGADVHHAVHVLRVRPGDELVAVEPGGQACRVMVEAAEEGEVRARVLERTDPGPEPHVTLVQGLAKGEKMDLVVEKSVELGVETILPAAFERSIVRLDADKASARVERWQRIALAAAKQSQRSYVPGVGSPLDISGVAKAVSSADIALLPWEEEASTAPGIGEALEQAGATRESRITIVVGPEGGLTGREVAFLVDAGAIVVSLGDTVIRTETAGILSVALCVYEAGGLGGRSRG